MQTTCTQHTLLWRGTQGWKEEAGSDGGQPAARQQPQKYDRLMRERMQHPTDLRRLSAALRNDVETHLTQ